MNESRRKKILVVDDEPENVYLVRFLCKKWGYDVIDANNGRLGVERAQAQMPDLILMDVKMPEMDGLDATRILKNDEKTRHIPIIVLTAVLSTDDRLKAIAGGANDYMLKPFDIQELSLRIQNHLRMKEYRDIIQMHSIALEKEVAEKTKELADALKELDHSYSRIRTGYIDTIHRLSLSAEYKDENTREHIVRTGIFSKLIAEALGMDEDFCNTIYYAAPMHDIGKVGISDTILLKQGKLDPEEWEIMKTHTTIGAKILSGSDSPFLKMAEEIALAHHEMWGGGGYPRGLKGEEIPLAARIMAVVDQYDALRSKRMYKPSIEHDKVVDILTAETSDALERFDPNVLAAFRNVHRKLEQIYEDMDVLGDLWTSQQNPPL